jgi:hypothetical protein
VEGRRPEERGARARPRLPHVPTVLALIGVCVLVATLIMRAGRPGPTSAPATPGHFPVTFEATWFLRGNLHAHTTRSDGDRPPEEVYAWYRDHGYAFVAVTDHDLRIDPAEFRALEVPGFVILSGEEITMNVAGKPVHVNALCHQRTIGGGERSSVEDALSHAVREVRSQGGVALVNHPNFGWGLSVDDLPHARGAQLLEVWSGHPHVRTAGGAGRPSHEAMWDTLLAAGHGFAGVAVDDVHFLDAQADPALAGPGRGWVEVFGADTTASAICASLAAGRLYFSHGVELRRVFVTSDTLGVAPIGDDVVVEFIGAGGAVLDTVRPPAGAEAIYRLRGGEVYVRARVTLPSGARAWTQAAPVAYP